MNSIKFIMALATVCMLVMPAFSMLDDGMGRDCKESCDCKKPCDCQGSMMGYKDNDEGVKIVIIKLDV